MDQPGHATGMDREPYESPDLTTLARVEDATLSSQETGQDALTQFSQATDGLSGTQ